MATSISSFLKLYPVLLKNKFCQFCTQDGRPKRDRIYAHEFQQITFSNWQNLHLFSSSPRKEHSSHTARTKLFFVSLSPENNDIQHDLKSSLGKINTPRIVRVCVCVFVLLCVTSITTFLPVKNIEQNIFCCCTKYLLFHRVFVSR